jgi:hypothetical protein
MRVISRSGHSAVDGPTRGRHRTAASHGCVADRGGAAVKRLMTRMNSIAGSPRAKAFGQTLARKAQEPATRAKISNGVRKLVKRKS